MALGLALALCVAAGASNLAAQPKLQLETTHIDAGVVYNGSSTTAKVGIKNIGNQDLTITDIHTSCGCTTVKEPKSVLKPGESDVLEVAFNSSGFRGSVEKYINIETNDPAMRFASITLSAEIRDELAPLTRINILWLGNVPLGKEIQQRVAFQNLSSHPIKIRQITSSSNAIVATPDKKIVQPNDSVSVSVSITPDREGYFSGQFQLETDSPNQPRVPMRIALIGVRKP